MGGRGRTGDGEKIFMGQGGRQYRTKKNIYGLQREQNRQDDTDFAYSFIEFSREKSFIIFSIFPSSFPHVTVLS